MTELFKKWRTVKYITYIFFCFLLYNNECASSHQMLQQRIVTLLNTYNNTQDSNKTRITPTLLV
jgi:hypothetical protein